MCPRLAQRRTRSTRSAPETKSWCRMRKAELECPANGELQRSGCRCRVQSASGGPRRFSSGREPRPAYLTGVLKALHDARVRIDVVLGRGVGALVAAVGAIDARQAPLRATTGSSPRWASAARGSSILFIRLPSPVSLSRSWRFSHRFLVGLVLLLALPFVTMGRVVTDTSAASVEADLARVPPRCRRAFLPASDGPASHRVVLLLASVDRLHVFDHPPVPRGSPSSSNSGPIGGAARIELVAGGARDGDREPSPRPRGARRGVPQAAFGELGPEGVPRARVLRPRHRLRSGDSVRAAQGSVLQEAQVRFVPERGSGLAPSPSTSSKTATRSCSTR